MIGDDREKRFLEEAQGLLNETANNLDDRTKNRLEQIRERALFPAGEKSPGFSSSLWRWILGGGLATAAAAGLALFFFTSTPPANFPRHLPDVEIITSREPIDFYQNLDFYRWMATQDRTANGKG